MPLAPIEARRAETERLGAKHESGNSSKIEDTMTTTENPGLTELADDIEALAHRTPEDIAGLVARHERSYREGFREGWRYSQTRRLNAPAAEDEGWKFYRSPKGENHAALSSHAADIASRDAAVVAQIVAWLWKNADDLEHAPRAEYDDHRQFEAGRAHEANIIRNAIERLFLTTPAQPDPRDARIAELEAELAQREALMEQMRVAMNGLGDRSDGR